ncbi:hypothetical protein OI25_8220 (plasmid) [Paraburkholderia fungorum]|uniref:Uncharacterized protein n=1 Tax=Paraburkholderia fungorum TaxID=134537 RepID=A0AAU8SSW5_9BURK|nr:hypothetical protein OI25_8220 [Paraburkholderia fungorum]
MTLFLGDTTHAYESERSSLCYRLLSVCPVSDGETDSQLNMACMLRRQPSNGDVCASTAATTRTSSSVRASRAIVRSNARAIARYA